MNKFLLAMVLSSVVSAAQAHNRPDLDSVSHRLEHLAMDSASQPYLYALGLTVIAGLALFARRGGRPQ
ncbi:hypothetical protein PL263_17315 [Methylomonas sp. EFPC3]|uniref:hypothetical protein n=1 Tax=Methylomonas TaxID=416 RepID=UPI00112E844A|nr:MULTISPECIES: hypothetical protein [Methylomonas]TPQ28242.1 hypothetical protein C2U68_05535 [Methylomonas koyamae]WFP49846.1 hypothetical protein PL263_17315 [Methylomonas sp. EFPC3]